MTLFALIRSHLFITLAVLVAPAVVAGQATPRPASLSRQHARTQAPAASVLVVRVVPDKNGPSVEIISTRPLVPEVQKLDGPPRLVIDLPNTSNLLPQKRVEFHAGAFPSDPVRAVRIDQFQNRPPITRVVIDLLKTSDFTWDLAGNLLTIRLRSREQIAPKPESAASLTSEPQPVVVPVSSGGAGLAVSLDRFSHGATVTAGSDTQIVNLGRGGEVRVCPGTSLSVTDSSNGRDLMFGMSTGAFEARYTLQSSADSVLTPDFRILLEGPGEFHYAISADSRGNTCMRPLPGNTASALVSELIGDEKYEVKAGEQAVFRSGRLTAVDAMTPADCGCPPAPVPVMRASAEAPATGSLTPVHLAQPGANSAVEIATSGAETAPLPPSKPHESHIQIEAPLVFNARDLPPSHPDSAPPSQGLAMNRSMVSAALPATVLPAASAQGQSRKAHPGFFGRVRGFFAVIFH